MASHDIQSLLDLDAGTALRTHQRITNAERLRWVAGALAIAAFASVLFHLFYADWLRLIAPLMLLGTVRWVFLDHEQIEPIKEAPLAITLILLFGLGAFLPADPGFGLELVAVLGALSVLAFRLRWGWAGLLLLAIFLGTRIPRWVSAVDDPRELLSPPTLLATASTPATLVSAAFTVLFFILVIRSTDADARRFAETFRIETSRNRERKRMRAELSSARQIQISMLPSSEPEICGLDVSAASLPAAEVGGDYYEYFEITDQKLAVVLADVAGHGVASGLLLSGVRSCLYLLHGEQDRPQAILEKLDRMLRATTQRRMFVTMLYCVFDLERKVVTEVSAGHPAALRYISATGLVESLDNPAVPLGTRLKPEFRERETELGLDDVVLLYTDGLTEILDSRGRQYGEERLMERFRRIARGRSAREIREAILSDVWNFKGNVEQHDDITLVAVRMCEPGGDEDCPAAQLPADIDALPASSA
jgi:serine phosphatase RsbU (regulator of sigma subunit)